MCQPSAKTSRRHWRRIERQIHEAVDAFPARERMRAVQVDHVEATCLQHILPSKTFVK